MKPHDHEKPLGPVAGSTAAIATVEQVRDALRARDVDAEVFDSDGPCRGVNIWTGAAPRYPHTTAYEPRADVADDGWAWGHNFEYKAGRYDDADEVARKVIESLARIEERA